MYTASNGIHTAVILRDSDPPNPREDWDNLGKMVCWHPRYNLGDSHAFQNSLDFAERMAQEYVSDKDLFTAIANEEIENLRLKEYPNYYVIQSHYGSTMDPPTWTDTGGRLSKDLEILPTLHPLDRKEDLLDCCSTFELLRLCSKSKDVVILPLYLYDHSGLSISTDSFLGRAHHAEWDSGQVGYIYMDKKTALENIAAEKDTLSICSVFPKEGQTPVSIQALVGEPLDAAMHRQGYSIVEPNHVNNLSSNEALFQRGPIYKKGRQLYALADRSGDNHFSVVPVAHFNPDLEPLNEETWKSRAEEHLRSEVEGYDNYLTGEVYGFELYEGTHLEDSCWGFFPGGDGIQAIFREAVSGWHPELAGKFEYEAGECFDIERYLEETPFPELEAQLRRAVLATLRDVSQTGVWPFAMSYQDIRDNRTGTLDSIVSELVSNHAVPTQSDLLHTVAEWAGTTRASRPKISVSDLDPARDYTREEVLDLFQNKQSVLDQLIQNAAKRSHAQTKLTYEERGPVR